MKFRIAVFNGQYFPQVKFWWSKWFRIGEHINGFGLYSANDYTHPQYCFYDAYEMIENYKKFKNIKKEPYYIYLED